MATGPLPILGNGGGGIGCPGWEDPYRMFSGIRVLKLWFKLPTPAGAGGAIVFGRRGPWEERVVSPWATTTPRGAPAGAFAVAVAVAVSFTISGGWGGIRSPFALVLGPVSPAPPWWLVAADGNAFRFPGRE